MRSHVCIASAIVHTFLTTWTALHAPQIRLHTFHITLLCLYLPRFSLYSGTRPGCRTEIVQGESIRTINTIDLQIATACLLAVLLILWLPSCSLFSSDTAKIHRFFSKNSVYHKHPLLFKYSKNPAPSTWTSKPPSGTVVQIPKGPTHARYKTCKRECSLTEASNHAGNSTKNLRPFRHIPIS